MRRPLKLRAWKAAVVVGAIQTGAFLICSMWALSLGGAGRTSVLVFTMPFWTLIFAWLILGERHARAAVAAVALAFAGLTLIVAPWDPCAARSRAAWPRCWPGRCWALGSGLSKKMVPKNSVDLVSFSAWQMLVATFPIAIAAWIVPSQPMQWTARIHRVLRVRHGVRHGAGLVPVVLRAQPRERWRGLAQRAGDSGDRGGRRVGAARRAPAGGGTDGNAADGGALALLASYRSARAARCSLRKLPRRIDQGLHNGRLSACSVAPVPAVLRERHQCEIARLPVAGKARAIYCTSRRPPRRHLQRPDPFSGRRGRGFSVTPLFSPAGRMAGKPIPR